MKILAFADTHGDWSAIKEIKKKAKKADIIICAGDFTTFENDIDDILFELNNIGKPLLIIHGNHEEASIVRNRVKDLDNILFIHKNKFEIGEYLFLGYGGGGFALTNKDFEKFTKKYEKLDKKKKIVLITHGPPHKTNLDNITGHHCGCKSIRKFLERTKVIIGISGHIHDTFGTEDNIKGTKVINPGPFGKIVTI
ncbi:hypothetical protein HN419_06490 [Candidatus Woesearchaeota archaeon]|jgi:uncharacterized protein|nr:hypothetical protein [Candidatus Woesearchaeota archaeon]MBT3538143.1 hypothetical protein [Candidatus Woesearchaeota archaeon]MBT4697498.1 hypothetical protein [Candidatus Woesearchaeota archaeon]MBT4716858.1 hypothetical protein [Candidatus Woesearchaeota archaeon]MBT7105812.1 hypothetical protein [Candidatus Woesearchaeota archaeon]